MFLSSFSQAVLHCENPKILTQSECNDFPNHPRNQKRNQNFFGWEHKAICRNQAATCLPSELHNLCKRNNCVLLIENYNWARRIRMLLTRGPGNGKAGNRVGQREKWKIVTASRLSNIPEDRTKRVKFTCQIHACFQNRKNKKVNQRAKSWSRSSQKVNERVKNSLSLGV